MTPEQLKASILQLAIQGKLVPQRPEEGTAEELYQQIQREKQKLISAGKLKKEKPLPPITEEEIPFDIPQSWKWVRLGDCTTYGQPKQKATPDQVEDDTWCLELEDIEKDTGRILQRLTVAERPIKGDRAVFNEGNVLFSKLRPYLHKILVADADGVCTTELVPFTCYNGILPEYMVLVLMSPCIDHRICSTSYGVKMPRVGTGDMLSVAIPLPPLAEQRRIVEKIEQMLPLVEQYGEAYTALESLDTRFPDDMRKSILQYAIQGKLVPQSPEDGTAEELYQQIQKEKKKLIAAGKLKKEKPLPPITEEEIPFDIPDSWKWVRMGDIFMHNTGKAQNSTAETRNGITRKFITTSNVYWNRFDFTKVKEMLFTEKEIEKCSVQKGDLLVCEGGDCGRAAIWQDGESMCIQNHIHRLRPIVGVEVMFFYYIFWLLKQMGYINGKGVGIKGLSSNTLHKLPCPLPPLAEQERIVKKLELILPQIGQTTAPTNA